MPGLYSHTTRSDGTTLTGAIYNTDHQNHIDNHEPQQMDDYSSTVAQMRTTTDPGEVGSESQPTSLAGELERLRYVWKTAFAWTQWYALKEGVLPRGFMAGLGLANNGVDADHDIDIAVGEARSSGDDADLNLTSAITKQIDAAWAVGTNQGGLDTGIVAADTWYHIHLIKRTDTGVVDALFSTSATAPTMPAGYDKRRRIGAVLTDGVANIIAFSQVGDEFLWDVPVQDYSAVNPGTTAVLRTMTVPIGVQVQAIVAPQIIRGAQLFGLHTSPDQADTTPSATTMDLETAANNDRPQITKKIRTNTSAQIRTRVNFSDVGVTVRGITFGWIDRRGRDD